jgi:geranyl-CoA carboxylase alpha subunit
MFDSILIANRGEIACRILRTARAMGQRGVAVFTDHDAGAPHAALAEDAMRIDSYLSGAAIIDAARAMGAGAIHPGYGFLSENADFADAVAAAGLVLIGPPAAAIRAMGDKAEARRRMIAANVPCVPGWEGSDQSDAALTAAAHGVGFPVMVKASAGGGGRGMRVAADAEALPGAIRDARAEAQSAFNDPTLILERAVRDARHIEIQVFADAHGACIHLGERDCSVQRRRQKVLEESPAPGMTAALRAAMGHAATEAARAVDYRGAGTVEFLLAPSGDFYFLEMNTRLQVEHPVTEAVTGLDLVALQIRVALGDPLGIAQTDVTLQGHAIEARLYAEDPSAGFLPSAGPIALWRPSALVRVDAGIAEGGAVSAYYDPMVAKLIAHGPNREEARRTLIAALKDTALIGPETNAAFLIELLEARDFAAGQATTGWLDATWPGGPAAHAPQVADIAAAAVLAMLADRDAAVAAAGGVAAELLGWSSAAPLPVTVALARGDRAWEASLRPDADGWQVRIGDDAVAVAVAARADGAAALTVDGRRLGLAFVAAADGDVAIVRDGRQMQFKRPQPGARAEGAAGSGRVTAPMHGLLTEICVAEGDRVAVGDRLAVLEAMKMQHRIEAPEAGVVLRVTAAPGMQLAAGDPIAEIGPEPAE